MLLGLMNILPLLLPENLHGAKVVIACIEVIAEDPILRFSYERHGVCEREGVLMMYAKCCMRLRGADGGSPMQDPEDPAGRADLGTTRPVPFVLFLHPICAIFFESHLGHRKVRTYVLRCIGTVM